MLSTALVGSLTFAAAAVAQPPAPQEQPGGQSPDPSGRVELVQERSEHAKVYLEPDGSKTAVISTEAVHFQAPDGSWKEIDNSIERDRQGDGFVNGGGASRFEFAGRGRSSQLVRIKRGDAQVSFGLGGALPRDAVVDGNTVTYPDVLPATDLRMSLHGESLKEMLILKAPPVVSDDLRIEFPLELNALTAAERDGGILLSNQQGEVVFRLPKPFMFDSNVGPESGDAAFSEDIHFEIEEGPGRMQDLVLVADGAWLLAPERVYPVYLDPTVFGPNSPSVDTYVQSNIFNTPQDQINELKSGYYEGPESPEPITTRSLLRFSLESITHGSTINSASLKVWNRHSYRCDPAQPVTVHRITTNWNSSVTWTNRPSFDQSYADRKVVSKGATCPGAEGYIDFNVRSIVSFWKNSTATNEGFLIKAESEFDVNQWKKWASDEGGNKPQLEVNYEDANRTPYVPWPRLPMNGDVTRTISPEFRATYEDPDGTRGLDEFQVFRATDPLCPEHSCAFRWGDGIKVYSGEETVFTPERDMPNGQYKWRARAFDGVHRSAWMDPVYFTLDAPQPPTITSAPPSYTRETTVSYSFTGRDGKTFECNLHYAFPDGRTFWHSSYRPCNSPRSYQIEHDAVYTFTVYEVDPDGSHRSKPATHSFTLDRSGPTTAPTVGPSEPASPSNSRTVSWPLSGEPGATFQCQLKRPGGAVLFPREDCSNRPTYTIPAGVSDGTFTLEAWQRDAAGNLGTAMGTGTYELDTKAGDPPSFNSTPANTTNDNTPTWEFTGETGATFECKLTQNGQVVFGSSSGDGFVTCSSPQTYTLTSDGVYTFSVRQIDKAGNKSGPQSHTFRLDRVGSQPSLLRSTTHIPHIAMRATQIKMEWTPPQDDSGTAGYYWTFAREAADGSSPAAPTSGAFQGYESTRTATSATLTAGRYWFKIRAVDKAGNVGQEVKYGPLLVEPEEGLPFVLSPTLDGLALAAQSDTNGLEQFYPFRSFDLGHHTGYANLHNGNLVVQATDVEIPGKGVNTIVRHTYNAQRTDAGYHDTGLGRGWTLSLADASAGADFAGDLASIDLNTPVVPTVADVVGAAAGVSGRILELTDGDGTVHRFTKPSRENGTRWDAPPGVDLRVREIPGADGRPKTYEVTRPDGVVYRVQKVQIGAATTVTWHVAEIVDRNGNKLMLTYQSFPTPALPPGKSAIQVLPRIRVSTISRQASDDASAEPVVNFYYHPDGKLQQIESVPGEDALNRRKIEFFYDADTTDDGDYLVEVRENTELALGDQRMSKFGYRKHERNLVDPLDDVYLLEFVEDGEGARTYFRYGDSSATGHNRLAGLCDRLDTSTDLPCDHPTTIEYGAPDPNTGDKDVVVRVPVDASTSTPTTYRVSGRNQIGNGDPRYAGGNVLKITDAGSPEAIVTRYEWFHNLLVKKVDGAGAETRMHYNGLGLLTKVDSPPVNVARDTLPANAPAGRIERTYVYDGVESAAYASTKCTPPGSSGHAQVSTEMWCDTMAETVRTTTGAAGHDPKRITDFDYDVEGNLLKVFMRKASSVAMPDDPDTGFVKESGDRVVRVEPNAFGGTAVVFGPREGVDDDVTYRNYDQSGLPREVVDARGHTSVYGFSGYGETLKRTDREGRVYEMTYDHRGNTLTSKDPDLDVTKYEYDFNDHRTAVTTPRGSDPGNEAAHYITTKQLNPNEWLEKVFRPGATAENPSMAIEYFLDGSTSSKRTETGARTTFSYHDNRLVEDVVRQTGTDKEATTTTTYDQAGRPATVTLPHNGTARPRQRFVYSSAGTVIEQSETSALAQDRVVRFAYNAFGDRVQVLGPRSLAGVTAEQRWTFDAWGQVTAQRTVVSDSKVLVHEYEYDDAGNVVVSRQPANDGGSLPTTFTYDARNLLETQSDPHDDQHFVRYSYTPEGRQKTREDVVGSNVRRVVTNTYNPDGSIRTAVSEDRTGPAGGPVPSLALCNFDAENPDGYDSNGNLLAARTVKGFGATPCGDGDVLRKETFTYDRRDRPTRFSQTVQVPGSGPVERVQDLTYRGDSRIATSKWDGRTTSYRYSLAGVLEEVTDWRDSPATVGFDHFAAGNLRSVTIPGAAQATLGYHSDGSPSSIEWLTTSGSNLIRRHSDIQYDVGGLRKSENVAVAHPATAPPGKDTGGSAQFGYDLAGRLTSWTSPFRLSETREGTESPRTSYVLDDSGNIKLETVRGAEGTGTKWIERTSTYTKSRLDSKTIETFGLRGTDTNVAIDETTTIAPTYNSLGEEQSRSTSYRATAAGFLPLTTSTSSASSYDPGGHTKRVDFSGDDPPQDVDYVYSADGQLIARTVDGRTTYFFYFASGSRLAEQTRPSGATKTRYLNSPNGAVVAEQKHAEGPVGDPVQAGPTWSWLLRDADGNVSTEVTPEGAVASQRAYDPYGSNDAGGTSKLDAYEKSDLGFQSDYTDANTGNVAMGPRLYDPVTARFTTADFYAGAASDAGLATDPLTGNRYLFAAANPVAFFDDGHGPLCDGEGCGNRGNSSGGGSRPGSSKNLQTADLAFLYLVDEIGRKVACEIRPSASTEEFLTGVACPPLGLPYRPVVVDTNAGPRVTDPAADGCTSLPGDPFKELFYRPCTTHDYGYDLLRVDEIDDHYEVDDFFHNDILVTVCSYYHANEADLNSCRLAARYYHSAVRSNGSIMLWWSPEVKWKKE